MTEIEITDEYKEFLINAFSKTNFYFRNEKVKKDIYSKLTENYISLELVLNRYIITKEHFEYFASLVVSSQKLDLCRDDFEKGSLKYDTATYHRNEHYYKDYFSYCGILLEIDYKYVVLVKTQEQLNNIFYSIRNDTDSYLQKFYNENYTKISLRRQTLIDKKQEEKDKQERDEIKQKLLEIERKKQLHRQALEELIEEGQIFNKRKSGEKSREPIPKEVMNQVWNRDGGKCVKCGSQENLEFDHIIPFSKGGAATYRNLQLLCQKCNRQKSDTI
jgi:hypothetical protein